MKRRPRLLVLASTFPASADDPTPAFIRDLALVESESYDTTVLVPSVPGGAPREQFGRVAIRRFRFFPRRWEDLAHGAILDNVRTRPSRIFQVPPFMIAETLAVYRAVRRLKPDVLHVHWLLPQGLAALIAARGIPMVITTLGGDLYAFNGPISNRLFSAIIGRAGIVTTMNEDMRQRVIGLGGHPAATRVLSMGAKVDSMRAVAEQQPVVPGRIVFVGRLSEKKGAGVLIEAIRLLSGGDAHLHVVGDGPLRAQLEAQARGLPVTFRGAQLADGVAVELGQADIAVFPSMRASSGDQDGLPVAMMEAMGTASVVVASDIPGIDEAIRDGVNGRLFPPGDSEALAAVLRDLLGDAEQRARLRQEALSSSAEYSISSIGARHVAMLDEVRSSSDERAEVRGPIRVLRWPTSSGRSRRTRRPSPDRRSDAAIEGRARGSSR